MRENAVSRTCFVCLQEGEEEHDKLARVCKCNTYVHATCFRALVTRVPSHATACPVCNTAYETQEEEEEQTHPLALVSLLTVSVLFGTDVVLLHMKTAIPWHVCFLLSGFVPCAPVFALRHHAPRPHGARALMLV